MRLYLHSLLALHGRMSLADQGLLDIISIQPHWAQQASGCRPWPSRGPASLLCSLWDLPLCLHMQRVMTAQRKWGIIGGDASPLGAGCGPAGARSRCCAASRRRLLRAVAASRQRLFWKRSQPPGSSFLHVAHSMLLCGHTTPICEKPVCCYKCFWASRPRASSTRHVYVSPQAGPFPLRVSERISCQALSCATAGGASPPVRTGPLRLLLCRLPRGAAGASLPVAHVSCVLLALPRQGGRPSGAP